MNTPSFLRKLFIANNISALSFSICHFGSQGFLGELWRSRVSFKEYDKEVPVPGVLKDLVVSVMDDLKMDKSAVNVFLGPHIDLKHWGHSGKILKSYLVVPQHFLISNISDASVIAGKTGEELNSDSALLAELKKSLVLSKEAKMYAIAHEINMTRHHNFYWVGILPVTTGTILNFLCALAKKHEPISRFTVFILLELVFLNVMCMFLFQDLATLYADCWADIVTAKLGESYIKGGIEYYEQLLKRNKIIKKISRKAPYTDDGDVLESFLHFSKVSLLKKVRYMKDLLTKSKGKKEFPSVWQCLDFNYVAK